MSEPLTRARVLRLAWPVVLAQAATATTGVVDTALMGRFGAPSELAAVAVASVAFSFIYWAFGFLRMSTTGLVAQCEGAGDDAQARAYLVRALVFGCGLGILLVLLQAPVLWGTLAAFQAEAGVEALAGEYFGARIWGAPAALMGYGMTGWLLGPGRTRSLLLFQIVLNGSNAILDASFVAGLDWGPAGIGAGTAIAEWLSLGLGFLLVRKGLRAPARVFDRKRWTALLATNRDILIRTLALLLSFAWFVNSGATIGTNAVAGNEVLLQFITVAAFILDAFAFVAEKEVGEAVGARDRDQLRRALRVTTGLSLGFGAVIAALFYIAGAPIIRFFVADPAPAQIALEYLPYCAAIPLLGVPAWQLDGVFLGATGGRALRIAAVIATSLYIATDVILAKQFGNTGVWIAFMSMYVYRAVALGSFVPGLLRLEPAAPSEQT